MTKKEYQNRSSSCLGRLCLSNRVPIIFRRYTDHMEFAAFMFCFIYHILLYSFGSILYHCIYGCMFCMLLFNFCKLCIFIAMFMYSYPYVCSVLGIMCHCVILCTVCV